MLAATSRSHRRAWIGVNAELEVVEWGIYIDRWVKRTFDAMVELRGGSSEPDRFLYRMIHSTGGVNNFLFKDAEVDALLDKGRALTKQGAEFMKGAAERVRKMKPVTSKKEETPEATEDAA